jgi:hypothetical protein
VLVLQALDAAIPVVGNRYIQTELYKVPAKEFLDLIAMTISEDSSDNDKARRKFNEIMQKAMEQKKQYDDAMSGNWQGIQASEANVNKIFKPDFAPVSNK